MSFQNGLHNAERLRGCLPAWTVLTGMVQFNVVNRGDGRFHHGSEGPLEVERHERLAGFLPALPGAGLPLALHDRMAPVQWAKLVLNLNNPVNALSDLPLKEQLSQRAFRRCTALAQAEALALLAAAGDHAGQAHAAATALDSLGCSACRISCSVASRGRMLAIDPQARSSMWEDLERRRKTEVDYLQGAIAALATKANMPAPVTNRIATLVKAAERMGGGSPRLRPEDIADDTA